jgi:hypothetical protein
MHNQVASVVSLAKTVLMGMDKTKQMTALPTATLELILNTLIDQAQVDNPTARRIEVSSTAYVASRISGVEGR